MVLSFLLQSMVTVWLRVIRWWICVLGLGFFPLIGYTQNSPPNFIFYIVDDVGWGDLACYGNPDVKTPHLDSLAAMGLKFENMYLTTSSCSPSRASIITGRYPHNTGAPELHQPIPKGQVLFPSLLRQQGYYTALSGKNHMGPLVKNAFDTVSAGKGAGGQEDWIEILRSRPTEKPFFFWLAAHDAHRDWQIEEDYPTYNPDEINVPPMLYDGPVTRQDLANYYHEISRADHFLGALMAELKKQNILDQTYIIFVSDNGSPFPRSKGRLYDSGIKSPFIVAGPGVDCGVTESLVSSIDISATVLELAGLPPEKRVQGVSFASLLFNKNNPEARDIVFAEHNWHVFQAHERMVRVGEWVYIRNSFPERRNLVGESTRQFPAGEELWEAYEQGKTTTQQEDVFVQPRPAEELYHVVSDPYQFSNVAGKPENKKVLDDLRATLDLWIEMTGDTIPKQPTPDRDDEHGRRLPGEWQRGERAGHPKQAHNVTQKGPVVTADVK